MQHMFKTMVPKVIPIRPRQADLREILHMLTNKESFKQIHAFVSDKPNVEELLDNNDILLKRLHPALARGITMACQQLMAQRHQGSIALVELISILCTCVFTIVPKQMVALATKVYSVIPEGQDVGPEYLAGAYAQFGSLSSIWTSKAALEAFLKLRTRYTLVLFSEVQQLLEGLSMTIPDVDFTKALKLFNTSVIRSALASCEVLKTNPNEWVRFWELAIVKSGDYHCVLQTMPKVDSHWTSMSTTKTIHLKRETKKTLVAMAGARDIKAPEDRDDLVSVIVTDIVKKAKQEESMKLEGIQSQESSFVGNFTNNLDSGADAAKEAIRLALLDAHDTSNAGAPGKFTKLEIPLTEAAWALQRIIREATSALCRAHTDDKGCLRDCLADGLHVRAEKPGAPRFFSMLHDDTMRLHFIGEVSTISVTMPQRRLFVKAGTIITDEGSNTSMGLSVAPTGGNLTPISGTCVPAWLIRVLKQPKGPKDLPKESMKEPKEEVPTLVAISVQLEQAELPNMKLQVTCLQPNPAMIDPERTEPIELTRMAFPHELEKQLEAASAASAKNNQGSPPARKSSSEN